MRGELRTLEGDGDIRISHPPAAFTDERHDFCQEDLAVNALPLVRRVGEQMPDVPEGQGAEARISSWRWAAPCS